MRKEKKATENKTLEPKMKKRIRKGLYVLLAILCLALIGLGAYKQTTRGKILTSVIYFTEHTLKSRDYIAYNVDIKELCREYFNSDLEFSGVASLNDIANFGFSSTMRVDGIRSFTQKKATANADLDVLFLNVGEFNFYVDNNTIYWIVPMLDNMSYGFEMDSDLFAKAPNFTANITKEWFRDHMGDIWTFVNDIEVEITGDEIVDEDGTVSQDYRITIPAGSGLFIYELLGATPPDYDMVADLYLTQNGHFRRLFVDLDNVMKDTTMTIDGEDVGTIIFTKQLPDNESMTTTMKRNGEYTYTNYISFESDYITNTGSTTVTTGYMTWDHAENGITVDVNDVEVVKDGELQTKAFFRGSVTKITPEEDIFTGCGVDFDEITLLQWKKLRDDMEGFVAEVREKAEAVVWK